MGVCNQRDIALTHRLARVSIAGVRLAAAIESRERMQAIEVSR